MYSLIRPFLFTLDAEKAHVLALKLLRFMPDFCFAKVKSSPFSLLGMTFNHPIGLAAGFDKNGEYLDALAKLGFSFIEVGTVTPKAQAGNAKPRIFRIPKAQAIINRMGFNNAGVDALIERIRQSTYQGILGINIGKNKDTTLNHAVEDYRYCLQKVYAHASYVTINISSPNTPDLRELQQDKFLPSLLSELVNEQKKLTDKHQRVVPLFVKLSPDENDDALKQMADVIQKQGIAGIIATNTTCNHDAIKGLPHAKESGGLSGKPLGRRSSACLSIIRQVVGKDLVLIGSGGIDSPAAAQEKIEAGANLLQLYSGLIYQGPQLIKKVAENTRYSNAR